MVEAESPPASLPSSAINASPKSPVAMPLRWRIGITPRPARVGRQNRRQEADALRAFADAVAHTRAAHGDRADAGHDLAFPQMSVAHQSLAIIIGQLVGMAAEQGRYFGLDGLRQQRSRACAKPRSAGPQKFLAGRVGKR